MLKMSDMARVVFPGMPIRRWRACVLLWRFGCDLEFGGAALGAACVFNRQQATQLVQDGALCAWSLWLGIAAGGHGRGAAWHHAEGSDRLRQQRVAHSLITCLSLGAFVKRATTRENGRFLRRSQWWRRFSCPECVIVCGVLPP